jgi:Acetyltransferases
MSNSIINVLNMDITCSAGTLQDLDLLVSMNVQLREDEKKDNEMSEDKIQKRMKGFLEGKQYQVVLIKEDQEIIGYSIIDIQRDPQYIRQLFIKSEKRNQGIGSIALEEIMMKFKMKKVDIEVMSWNKEAYKFYIKNGFKERYIGLRLEIE